MDICCWRTVDILASPLDNIAMKMPEKIETERLILVPMSMEYAPDVFRELTPEIVKYMSPPSPKKIQETIDWIEKTVPKIEAGEEFTFAILKKDTKEFIGGGGIHKLDTKVPEFGIWTKKSSHGHKFGREAIKGARKWLDENIEYEYLRYPCAKVNIASCKIAESLGGVVEHEYIDVNGSVEEMLLLEYRIYR